VLLPLIFLLGCQALSQKQGPATSKAGQLTCNSASFIFGSVPMGASVAGSVVVINAGGSRVTISQAKLSTPGFSVTGISLPLVLNPNQSTKFDLNFVPRSPGSVTGNLSLMSDATNPNLDIAFSGVGVAPGRLTVSPSNVDFGSILMGTTQSLPVVLVNSGASGVTISQASPSGTGFNTSGLLLPLTLAPGQSASFSVVFAPQSAGKASGSVTLLSDAVNPTMNLPLAAIGLTPGALVATPSSPAFGTVQVGNTKSLIETLTNSGGSPVTISQVSAAGAGFDSTGLILPISLNAGQSTTFSIEFSPATAGNSSGSFAVLSTATNANLTLPASGTGVAPGLLTANPPSQSFGTVSVGTSKSLSQTFSNSGGSNLTIANATITGAGFTSSGLTLPLTLNPGQSTTFTVKFAPSAAGSANGSMTMTSSGSNPSLTVPLGGTGVLPAGTLNPNPSTLSFGTVQTGNSKSVSETLMNSGPSSVTISQANLSGNGFSVSGLTLPLTLNAGQSATFNVLFVPQSAGSTSGNLSVVSSATNSTLNITLGGTGVTPGLLSANPTNQSFGSVTMGISKTLAQTVTNSGGSAVTLSQVLASGTGFSLSGISPPVTLSAGQSFTFNAIFSPAASGSVAGTISLTSNASNPNLTIALSGTGTAPGQLALTPGSVNFGNVVLGATATQSGTLNAIGGPVTISAASINSSEFVLSGISLPLTLSAGSGANFTIAFTPQASGTVSTNLTFISNASNSSTTQSLTGNGTVPVQHSVALAWNASTSSNVVGYNIYRGTIPGGPYTRINASLYPSTNDTDSSVQSGQTYFYVVTAVDSSANESSYSNEVQAIIP
jgi:Cep192 domain 4/Abnormal spindle-like microcephaly-assoc'd, ASPM-SPD-2-Hydin/HYDIN/CFA65/VesB-like, Ig-like domain